MRLSPIVLRLRAAPLTRYGNKIAGAAELGLALDNTLLEECAFVVQISETASANPYDTEVSQLITEVFSVIVAIKNDLSQADKTGITAYDSLYDIRREIIESLLGWQMQDEPGMTIEGLVSYAGGKILDVNSAWLWYQFDFTVPIRFQREIDVSGLDELDKIYTQYIMTPSKDIPLTGPTGLTVDTSLVDMAQMLDFTTRPEADFARGFGFGFKLYEGG